MTIGLGTDIVEIVRIKKAVEKGGEAFLEKVYTPQEISSYAKRNKSGYSYLAGRWAAKEAFSKALGCGIGENCSLSEIDISETPSGAPALELSGNAKKIRRSSRRKQYTGIYQPRSELRGCHRPAGKISFTAPALSDRIDLRGRRSF